MYTMRLKRRVSRMYWQGVGVIIVLMLLSSATGVRAQNRELVVYNTENSELPGNDEKDSQRWISP